MKIYFALLIASISFDVYSCDVCGGVSTPSTLGIQPNNQFHFIGMRFGYNSFNSAHTNNGNMFDKTTEQFTKTSVVGRWQVFKRLNLLTEVPFHHNTQVDEDNSRSKNGIGDIVLQCNYLWINKKNETTNRSHILTTGIGAKLPTGAFAKDAWETNNLYPGTGSVDIMMATNYVYSWGSFGLMQESVFTLKTKNSAGYQYGNTTLLKVSGLYKKKIKEAAVLIPLIGLNYFQSSVDRIDGILVSQSFNNGHSLNGVLGLNFISQKWMINSKFSLPVYQFIDGGNVTSKGSIELGVTYLIQKK